MSDAKIRAGTCTKNPNIIKKISGIQKIENIILRTNDIIKVILPYLEKFSSVI